MFKSIGDFFAYLMGSKSTEDLSNENIESTGDITEPTSDDENVGLNIDESDDEIEIEKNYDEIEIEEKIEDVDVKEEKGFFKTLFDKKEEEIVEEVETVEEVDSQSSTPRMFTKISNDDKNEEKNADDEKE